MIRPATSEDMPRLIEMGRAFVTEARYADEIAFVPEDFTKTLAALHAADLLRVLDSGGKAIGMGAADVGPTIFNYSHRIAREAFWYVDPEHRRGSGMKLLNALELAAKSQGARIFDAVAEEGKRSEALARLYRAGGYSPAEHTFRKRL